MDAHRRTRLRTLTPLIAVVIAMLVVPAAVSAQQISPTERQYRSTLTQVGSGADTGLDNPTPTSDRVVDALPFTGLDIGLLLAVAALVGGSGVILRRAAGSPRQEG